MRPKVVISLAAVFLAGCSSGALAPEVEPYEYSVSSRSDLRKEAEVAEQRSAAWGNRDNPEHSAYYEKMYATEAERKRKQAAGMVSDDPDKDFGFKFLLDVIFGIWSRE